MFPVGSVVYVKGGCCGFFFDVVLLLLSLRKSTVN